ncbi:MAG: DUF488 domain-containing protein [Chromatiales bacterium]
MGITVHTIGHSNHGLPVFLGLLSRHAIALVCDVRSRPYSRRCPHFSRRALEQALARSGIGYLFLGTELGARPADPAVYVNGRIDPALLVLGASFRSGLQRVLAEARRHRLALLCAERDPIRCHRMILVSRALRGPEAEICHILPEGDPEPNAEAEVRLLKTARLAEGDLFADPAARIDRAYDLQAQRIAYALPAMAAPRSMPEPARGTRRLRARITPALSHRRR